MNQMDCKCKHTAALSILVSMLLLLHGFGQVGGYGALLFLLSAGVVLVPLSFYSTFCADALGTMQNTRRKKGQYKNVLVIRRQMPFLMFMVSVLWVLAELFFGEKICIRFFQMPLCESPIRFLSPVLLIFALETPMLAFFQGSGKFMPTMLKWVMRPLLYGVLGKIFLGRGLEKGEKVANLLKKKEMAAMHGVCAMMLTIVVSELIILAVLFVLYLMSRRDKDRRKSAEGVRQSEGTVDLLRNFFSTAGTWMLSMLLLFLPLLLGLSRLLDGKNLAGQEEFGRLLCVLLPFPLTAFLVAGSRAYLIGIKLKGIRKQQDNKHLRHAVEMSVSYAVRIGIFFTVMGWILEDYFLESFLSFCLPMDTGFLKLTTVSMLLWSIALVCLAVISAHGKKGIGMLMTLGSGVLSVILSLVLPGKSENGTSGYLYALLAGVAMLALLTFAYVVIQQYFQINFAYLVVVPLIGGAFTGLLLLLVLKIVAPHIGALVSLLIGIVLGTLLYYGILSAVKNITSQDIRFLYEKNTQKLLGLFIK